MTEREKELSSMTKQELISIILERENPHHKYIYGIDPIEETNCHPGDSTTECLKRISKNLHI